MTERRNPASAKVDELSTEGVLRVISAADAEIASAVEREIPEISRAVDAIVEAIQRHGRLFYIGAGTSGRLGVLDAAECPPTFGVSEELITGIIAGGEAALSRAAEASEDDPQLGAQDLLAAGFSATDVLVGIAASGRTPYVLGAIAKAREMGAVTVGISCTSDSDLSRAVDIAIEPKPGPEVLTGSTRMRAGTATKLVLNMLTTATMIRLGYTYGNLMVNVQPRNEKLVDRARRVIAEAAGISYERAAELLEASGLSVKTAIVMAKRNLSAEQANARLNAAGGIVKKAIANDAPAPESGVPPSEGI